MEKKSCIKCRVFECDTFLVLLMSNQIYKPDLQPVRKLHIYKMTSICNKGYNLPKSIVSKIGFYFQLAI